MATTERSPLDARIQALFRRRVAPLAERLRAEHRGLFPLGPEAGCPTYYTAVQRSRMEPADFVRASGLTRETLEAKLRALWEARALPELAELAPDLARLARELSAEAAADGDEVSPFVYVMY